MANVDTGAWDGGAAMSAAAASDDPAAAYAAICAGRREGDPALQSSWALPHHSAPGDPPNADGCRNAMSRLPQTDGLTNADEARAHLERHMAAVREQMGMGRAEDEHEHPEPVTVDLEEVRSLVVPADIEVRDLAKREVDVRLLPWDYTIETVQGPERFSRGAFDDIDPSSVFMYPPEHELKLGLGQDGRPQVVRIPTGRAISLGEDAIGPRATFRVARTAAGDESLALMADRILTGVSVEFSQVPGGTDVRTENGRRVRVHNRARLTGAVPTHRPAYGEQAAVLAVRSQTEEGQMATETQEAVAVAAQPTPAPAAPAVDITPITSAITELRTQFGEFRTQMSEQARAAFTIPAAAATDPEPRALRGDWMHAVIRMLSGERVPDQQLRTLADLVTADNVGVIPDAFSTELIGVIDPSRPFLGSTRRLDLPPAGMSLVVPKIVTRPTAGVQAVYGDESYPEKSDVASTATSITNVTFDAVTIAGGGDISLQLLKRSSPSYLSLFLELLAEAYGSNAESEALATLLDTVGTVGGVNDGGTLDPENLLLGDAWQSAAAVKKPLTTMWLSSAGVAGFIDAKASTTNAPLYSQIQSGFTAGAGAAGTISGLRPVYVPSLDATAYDVLVGPSSGFGWTEDGTYTLQVDVPAKAGRDVALVGMLWFAPMYPTAFTAYAIGS